MKSYEGYCRGGPWDGKQYAHYQSVMVLEQCEGLRLSSDESPPEVTIFKAGEYRHVAGQWIWHSYA